MLSECKTLRTYSNSSSRPNSQARQCVPFNLDCQLLRRRRTDPFPRPILPSISRPTSDDSASLSAYNCGANPSQSRALPHRSLGTLEVNALLILDCATPVTPRGWRAVRQPDAVSKVSGEKESYPNW